MTSNILELKEQRARNKELMRDMVASAKKNKTDVNQAAWNRFLDEDADLQTQILEAEKKERAAEEQANSMFRQLNKNGLGSAEIRQFNQTWHKYMTRAKGSHMTQEEEKILTRGTGNQTTTTTAGGFMIPEGFSNELFVEKALWGGMFEAARIVETETGNTLPWPKTDDTAEIGEIISEGSSHNVGDIAYTELALGSFLYSSKIVKVSEQLLQDGAFDMKAHLNELFARRIGSKQNADFTTGAGTTLPYGFITQASSGVTATAVTTVTAGELNSLIHSVDPVYRRSPKCFFMMNDTTLAAIKVLDLTTSVTNHGRIYTPAMGNDTRDRIFGYPVVINQDMADLDNSSKSIAFGDFSNYLIRIVKNSQRVKRFDELYAANLLVGFLGYERADGALLGTNAIKYITQAST